VEQISNHSRRVISPNSCGSTQWITASTPWQSYGRYSLYPNASGTWYLEWFDTSTGYFLFAALLKSQWTVFRSSFVSPSNMESSVPRKPELRTMLGWHFNSIYPCSSLPQLGKAGIQDFASFDKFSYACFTDLLVLNWWNWTRDSICWQHMLGDHGRKP